MTRTPVKVHRLLPALGLLAVLTACTTPAERLIEEAARAREADAIHEAAHLYREVTILAPDDPRTVRAHYELAQIYYLRRRNIAAAKAELLTVVQAFPGSEFETDAKRLLAHIYADDLREHHTAVRLYREVLDDETLEVSERREALLELAQSYYRAGDTDRAAATYRRVIDLPYDSDTAAAYLRLANLSQMDGSSGEALQLVRELARIATEERDRREAQVAEVSILLAEGKLDAAGARLDDAGLEHPGSEELAELDRRLRDARMAMSLDAKEERSLAESSNTLRWGATRRTARGTSQ